MKWFQATEHTNLLQLPRAGIPQLSPKSGLLPVLNAPEAEDAPRGAVREHRDEFPVDFHVILSCRRDRAGSGSSWAPKGSETAEWLQCPFGRGWSNRKASSCWKTGMGKPLAATPGTLGPRSGAPAVKCGLCRGQEQVLLQGSAKSRDS